MRVGILLVGIVLAILGFLLIFSFIGFVLVTIGVIVAISLLAVSYGYAQYRRRVVAQQP